MFVRACQLSYRKREIAMRNRFRFDLDRCPKLFWESHGSSLIASANVASMPDEVQCENSYTNSTVESCGVRAVNWQAACL